MTDVRRDRPGSRQLALVAELERAMIHDRVTAGEAAKEEARPPRPRPCPLRLPLDRWHPRACGGAHPDRGEDPPRRARRLDARPDRAGAQPGGYPLSPGRGV